MKTLFRVVVILVIASLLGGLMVAAVNALGNSAGGSAGTEIRQRPPQDGGFDLEGRPERGGFEGGMFLPFGVLKSFIIVGLIALIYFQASRYMIKRSKPIKSAN